MILGEMVLTALIIRKVSYTEIDWIAYMQEVKGVMDGEYDYQYLKGDTGPLVYPAGFVYVYSWLYHLTNEGTNLLGGQYVFFGIYLYTLVIVLAIYKKSSIATPLAMGLLTLSKRIHSIFVLRLFNDCVAMALVYTAILLFVQKRWKCGCVFYSLAVSVKMNILLFSPGLLLLLIQAHDSFWGVFYCLSICASIQLVLALPFLLHAPISYLRGAFDIGRIFQFKWTVNWKFLPEDLFVSKEVAIVLLVLTLAGWIFFFLLRQQRVNRGSDMSADYIIRTLFVSNVVGVVFARTLHYQFYVWYFHQLPFLLWSTSLPLIVKLGVLGAIEAAFNVYPATPISSGMLQAAHMLLMGGLIASNISPDSEKGIKEKSR